MAEENRKEMELLEKIKTEVSQIISEKQKNLISKEEIETRLEEIKSAVGNADEHKKEMKEQVEKLEKVLKEQGLVLESMKNANGGNVQKTAREIWFDLLTKNETFQKYKANGYGGSSGEIRLGNFGEKAAGDMSSGGNLTNTPYPVILPDRRGPVEILDRPMFMREIMRTGTTISDKIDFVKEANRDGTPAAVAEGNASAQIDFDLIDSAVDVERVGAHLTVSRRMLDDIPYLANYISRNLSNRLLTVEDTLILSGTGVSPQISGLITNATAWSVAGTSFDKAVSDPTYADVMRVAIHLINVAYYRASQIIVHPESVTLLDLDKATSGQYIKVPFMNNTNGNITVVRVPIFETTAITAGKFLVGDFVNGTELVDRQQYTIEFSDHHSDNFTKNKRTIRIEERIALPIYRTESFIYGDLTSAIADLTKV